MITIILCIRSEIIKKSPVIRACEALGEDYFTLHIGKYYSYEMDRTFFGDIELSQPEYKLDVGSGAHAKQIGRIMMGIEQILLEEKSKVVLVRRDTHIVRYRSGRISLLRLIVCNVKPDQEDASTEKMGNCPREWKSKRTYHKLLLRDVHDARWHSHYI